MKATAHQAKFGTTSTSRASGKSAQAKARQGGGNRHRADAFERQADELAIRAMRGDTGLGTKVRKTTAADYRLPSSAGSPLPFSLRQQMDNAFGADFSTVRVHTDSAAALAAREEEARAFTSGRDIFFAANQFSQNSHEGRLLIAHELTHVLQQSSSLRSDGRVVVGDNRGGGDLQRREFYYGPRPFPASGTLTDLASVHRDATPAVQHEDFDDLVASLRDIVGDSLSTLTAGGPELARRVNDEGAWTGPDTSSELRSLVCDTLKATGQHEAAGLLMALDPLVRTVGHSQSAFEYAIAMSPVDWENEQLGREPLRRYFPWQFIDTYRRLLFGPTRAIQSLYAPGEGLGEFQERFRTITSEVSAGSALTENELYFCALETLRRVDEVRRSHTQRILTRLREANPNASPLYLRYALSLLLRDQLSTLLASAIETNAADRMLVRVLPSVVTIAQRALALWEVALRLTHRGAGADQAMRERWRQISQRTELQPLRDGLVTISNTLLGLVGGNVPSASLYRQRVVNAKTRSRQLFYNEAEEKLIALARVRAGTEMDEDLALAYAVLLDVLPRFITKLDEYDATADRTFIGGQSDIRIAHRIRVARWLAEFGTFTSWDEFLAIARPILTATQETQTENQVAILGDWTEDRTVQIADFADDEKGFASARPIGGLGFLNSYHISTIFLIDWYERVTREVAGILATEEGDYSADVLIIPRVRASLAGFVKPRRFIVESSQYEIAHPAIASVSGATAVQEERTTIYQLVMQHPKTQAKLAAEGSARIANPLTATQSFPVSPVDPPGGTNAPLYFWIVPPLENVVRHLRAIPGLEAIVLAAVAQQRAAESAQASQAIDPASPSSTVGAPMSPAVPATTEAPVSWLDWVNAFTTLQPDQLASYQATLTSAVSAESGTDRLTMLEHLRRALAHDRRIVTAFRVRPKLAQYSRYDITTYTRPDEAFRLIEEFTSLATPPTDRDRHLALIMLDLFRSPAAGQTDIAEIISGFERYDLIVAWQALLRQSVREANEGRPLLIPVMTSDERADLSWIDASIMRMNRAIEALEERKRTVQLRFGFVGLKERSAEEPAGLASAGSSRRIPVNETFQIDGVSWTLLEVYENFQFFPDYGNPNTESYTPSILRVDGVDVPAAARSGRNPTSRRPLLRVTRGTRIIIIHENDDALLEELSNAVGMQVIVAGLEELAAFIESAAEAMLELAEFIPGAGQAVMATRLAISIITFIASDEFAEIKEMVFEDPLALFDPLLELVRGDLFEPESILEWMVLGGMSNLTSRFNATADRARTGRRRRPPRTRPRTGTLARFAAMVQRVWSIGAGLGRALGRTRNRARRAFLGVETFVLERPILVEAFQFAANNIDRIEHYASRVASLAGEEGLDLSSEIDGFSGEFGEIIGAINAIEIPEEIVPLDEVLEIVINLILDRLGAKYRLAGRAILYALDALGLKQDILDAVVQQVPEELNPNHYWGELVRNDLRPRFVEFRSTAIESMSHVLTSLGFPSLVETQVDTVEITPAGNSFPESEALLSPHTKGAPANWPDIPITAGQPLTTTLRRDAETRIGHEFSHVRLHLGTDAAPVTGHFGAEGITSGSHVYLRPGLDPARGEGSKVLRHELTHVIQQTGLRPLGGTYTQTPVTGRAGRGLHIDTKRESEAASAAEASAPGKTSMSITPDAEAGPQPMFSTGTLSRMLRGLSRGGALFAFYERTEDRSATAGTTALPAHVATEVAHVGERIWSLFSGSGPNPTLVVDEPFDRARTEIGTYFQGRHNRSAFQNIVAGLALQSLVRKTPRTGRPAAGASGSVPPPIDDLNVRLFRSALEGLLLSMGLGMRIDFNGAESDGEGGLRRFRINAGDPLRRVRLVFLYMPEVGSASALWDTLMTDTFGAAPGSAERNRLFPRARAWLSAERVSMGLWDRRPPTGKKLVLSHRAKTAIEALLTVAGPAIAANELPGKTVYLSRTPAEFSARGSVGYVGLHVGVYRDAAQTGATKGRERESHHTTQFLLLEYFRNWKDDKPFKHDLSLYPGLHQVGGAPDKFVGTSGREIKIRDMTGDSESARGPGMPTLSLAAVTHNNNIHVQGERDDDPTNLSRSAPGYAVKNRFRNAIASPDLRDAMFASTDTDLRALMQPHMNRRQGAQTEIFNAMQATYRWMRGDMFDRLEPELKAVETKYYNDISSQAGGPGDQLTSGDMDRVMTYARDNNDTVFSAKGWTTS